MGTQQTELRERMQSVSSLLTTPRAALVASRHPLSKKKSCCSKSNKSSSGVGGIRRRQRTTRSQFVHFNVAAVAAENEEGEDEDDEGQDGDVDQHAEYHSILSGCD